MSKRVYLYGFTELHHVVMCDYLTESRATTQGMDYLAIYMLESRPDISNIYAVNNRPGLKDDFLDAIIRPHFTKDIEFEDLIQREKIRCWKR